MNQEPTRLVRAHKGLDEVVSLAGFPARGVATSDARRTDAVATDRPTESQTSDARRDGVATSVPRQKHERCTRHGGRLCAKCGHSSPRVCRPSALHFSQNNVTSTVRKTFRPFGPRASSICEYQFVSCGFALQSEIPRKARKSRSDLQGSRDGKNRYAGHAQQGHDDFHPAKRTR